MDVLISHAYGFAGLMLLILACYIGIYAAKIKQIKSISNKPANSANTAGENKIINIIRPMLTGINLLLHILLILFTLYADAGIEILLLLMLMSAAIAIIAGGTD